MTTAARSLKRRLVETMDRLHDLSRGRDAGFVTLRESLDRELKLAKEADRIQERLRFIGARTPGGGDRKGRR